MRNHYTVRHDDVTSHDPTVVAAAAAPHLEAAAAGGGVRCLNGPSALRHSQHIPPASLFPSTQSFAGERAKEKRVEPGKLGNPITFAWRCQSQTRNASKAVDRARWSAAEHDAFSPKLTGNGHWRRPIDTAAQRTGLGLAWALKSHASTGFLSEWVELGDDL